MRAGDVYKRQVNVVPGKAYAVTEGLDREVMDQVAAEVEKEIGVHFDLESEDTAAGVCQVKVTAVAVSYTHLDVYKRQSESRREF